MIRFVRALAISALITFFLFCLLEGLVSAVGVGLDIVKVVWTGRSFHDDRGLPEARYARHSPDLGWVSIPNLRVDDLYGPGMYLKTNEHGFRNDESFGPKSSDGRFRIMCSGDSFTLGFGVSNKDAWCNRLSAIDRHILGINMGQGGYGVGQAYLWYKHDGIAFDHDVQLFAIIRDDLHRMMKDRFQGFEKPVLKLRNGKLVAENVPVPDGLFWRKLRLIKLIILRKLALATAARWVAEKAWGVRSPHSPAVAPSAGADRPAAAYANPELSRAFRLTSAIISDLADINARKKSRLVFILFPTWADWKGDPEYAFIRRELRRICRERNVELLDLTDAFRQLDYGAAALLFRHGVSGGHYSVQGNAFVARKIFDRLVERGIYVPSGTR